MSSPSRSHTDTPNSSGGGKDRGEHAAAFNPDFVPRVEYEALREAAKDVVDLYPTIAGTAILIKDANSYVPRNPWDSVADAVYKLSRVIA